MRTREEGHSSFQFDRNIVYFDRGTLLGSSWSNNHFHMDNNIYWRTGGESADFKGVSLDQWWVRDHDKHSRIAYPLFVASDRGDFTLKPASPALALGFKTIEVTQFDRLAKP
tara:strand:+ start:48 stop:383 length:336 start_codon:yes stop_codon:yes gene_type:complete